MRILSIYYTHKPGGLCKRFYRLMGALAVRGHQVNYLSLDAVPYNFPAAVKVILIPFPLRQRRGALFWFLFSVWCPVFILYQVLLHKPDRLLSFNPYYSLVLAPAKILFGIKAVLFLRASTSVISSTTGQGGLLQLLTSTLERVGITLSDKVVCITNAMAAQIAGVANKHVAAEILPNDLPKVESIDRAQARSLLANMLQLKLDDHDFVVATLGVIDKRKNISLVLDALSLIKALSSEQKIYFIVCGSGSELGSLKIQADNLALPNVFFIGWLESPWQYLAGIDLYLHPSLHEGMSNAVLEAAAYGIPFLLSNTLEHLELVQQEQHLLFQLDRPELLAERLSVLSRPEPQGLASLIKESNKVAQELRFDWEEAGSQAVLRQI